MASLCFILTIRPTINNNGNLLSKTDGADSTLYTWDYENRLVQISNSQFLIFNEYDPDGNRISKTVDGVTTKYINDVGLPLVQVIMETNESDTVFAFYTYGNDLISVFRPLSSDICFYHYDGIGSTRQLTGDTETVIAEYTYDAFGNLIASTGTSENVYKFTGEQFNSSSGLLYLRARYYDSGVGRFISRDPILEPVYKRNKFRWYLNYLMIRPQDLLPYLYASNNPINLSDPAGFAPQRPGCDFVGDIFPSLNENRCFKSCCDQHDDCFAANNCSAVSWTAPCYLTSWRCHICNRDVALCFIGCATLPGLW